VKITGLLMAGGAALYLLIAAAYWFITKEIVGTTALALTGGLALIIGYYLLFTSRRVGHQPEDNPTADIEDADADYGFFSPHSWWPIAVALSVGIVMVGLAFAAWIVILGVVLLVGTLIGFVFEYYRGPFADV
jgi:hypothetical protein